MMPTKVKMRAQSGMARFAKHEMGKFKKGTLHSGSKKGPKVKSRKQAVAIMLSSARKKGLLK
jgi:hypothetical protein